MRRVHKWTFAAAAGLTVAACLAALLVALAPRWVGRAPVRTLLLSRLSAAVGGKVECGTIELAWFPAPRVVLRHVAAAVPGKWSGTAPFVAIYPKILPLFAGRIVPARVVAAAPSVEADLAGLSGIGAETALTLDAARRKSAALLAALSAGSPRLVLEVESGRVTLRPGSRPPVELRNVRAQVTMPPGALKAELRCESNLWGSLSLRGELESGSLDGKAEFALTGVDAAKFAGALLPSAAPGLQAADAALSGSIATTGMRAVRAEVTASSPSAGVRRGDRTFAARGLRIAGSIEADERAATVSVKELSAASPAFRVAGKVVADRSANRLRISLDARDVAVATVREALRLFPGDNAAVGEIFSRIEGGDLRTLSVETEGDSTARPATVETLVLEARLRRGTVRVREAGLLFTEVSADVTVSGGTLRADRLAGRLGASRVTGGTLSLGLAGRRAPFRAALSVDADLPDIPPILARVAGSDALARELSMVEALEGRAAGKLQLGDRLDSLKATVDASDLRLSARYRRFPFPIRIAGGRFVYEGGRIGLRNLAGSAGRSAFSDLSLTLRTAPSIVIEESSGRHSLALEELHPWVSSLPGVETLSREVRAVEGLLEANVHALSGRVDRPAEWRFEADGAFRDVALSAARLPGPLAVASGSFRIVPEALSLSGVKGRLLDASFSASGALRNPFSGPRRIEGAGDGSLGAESARWLLSLLNGPPGLALRTPLAFSGARIAWGSDNGLAVAGTASVAGGPTVSLDFRRREGDLEIRNVSVRDDESRAAATLSLTRGGLELSFKGQLTGGTAARLLVGKRMPEGRLAGDFSVFAPPAQPARATARGRLEATGVRFPELLGPLAVDELLLEAEGNRLSVRKSALSWDGSPFTVAGSVEPAEPGLRVDLDLSAGAVSWETLREAFAAGVAGSVRSSLPPVAGIVRVTAESFDDGKRVWRPVRADVVPGAAATRITLRQADYCGISVTGQIDAGAAETAVDLQLSSRGPDVGPLLTCLRREKFRMTGSYRLSARVAGRGTAETLPRALSGSVELEATGGRIHRATLLSKILAVVNVTQLVFGKIPDLAHGGFAYNRLHVRGDVSGGRLLLREAALDAASANFSAEGSYDILSDRADLVVLASPLKTVDAILRRIPVVGYILGGSLVSVPFRVKGDPGDPEITVLPPAEVGKGLLGVVERTLKAPIRLISPVLPKELRK